jgi:hypothetical protein
MTNKLIGTGEYSSVYKICNKKKCSARKNGTTNIEDEYKITKLLHELVPKGIIKPLKLKGKSLYLELMNLNNSNKNKIYSLKKVKKVLKHVVSTLIEIQKKYPSFRHNDLHWENVFVSPNGKKIAIGDFGFSNIQLVGYKNPIVQNGLFEDDYGIGKKTNKKYDIAFLLNDIHLRGNHEIKRFIETLIPLNYIGETSTKLIQSRMRYNVNHSKFPSLKKIFDKLYKHEYKKYKFTM